ncbi:MAG TPA: hypothetical protein VMW25_01625 [Clostridia bacterium]|nr:hypothetical protein [Clostridia bacterium]
MAKTEKNKTIKETRHLKCDLTKEELLQAGEDLAKAIDGVTTLEEQLASVQKDFKAKIAALEAEITIKQRLVRNKNEFRFVECQLTLNYTTLQAVSVRTDTEEIIEERKMTQEEKQMKIEFDKDKKTA